MKTMRTQRISGRVAAFALSIACCGPVVQAAPIFSDDFSTDTLSSYTLAGASGVSYNATAGVGGGGGLVINQASNDSTSIIPGKPTNTPFVIGAGPTNAVTISMMLKLNTNGFGGGTSKAFVGLTDGVNYGWGNGPLPGTAVIGGVLQNAVEIGTRLGVSPGGAFNNNTQPGVTTWTGGNWYLFSTTLEKPTTGTTWKASGFLQNFGADGTVAGSVLTSFSGLNVALNGDTTLSQPGTNTFFNFGVRNQSWSAVDNFSVTAVPEPASLALVGAAGLIALRRRRNA